MLRGCCTKASVYLGRFAHSRHFACKIAILGSEPDEARTRDLRHACATLLLGKNVNPKVVSEMLGHASVRITLDTYSHLMPDMQEQAAKAMEEALSWSRLHKPYEIE